MDRVADGAARPPTTAIAGIDGIRAIAAVSVVVFHIWSYGSPAGAPPAFPGSGLLMRLLPAGVTLFFALSGFLLYRPFAAAILEGRRLPNLWRYSRNRGLRILPAYWAILLLVGVVMPGALLRVAERPFELGRLTERPGLLLADLALVQNHFPDGVYTGIGPAWSLVVEVAFYVALPVMALLAARTARGRTAAAARLLAALSPAAALFVIGMMTKVLVLLAGGALGRWRAVLEVSPAYHADLFAYGMAATVLILRVDRIDRGRLLMTAAGLGAAAALVLADLGAIPQGLFESAVAACASLVVLVIAGAPSGPAVRALSSRVLTAVGLASYSLYLWHEPLVHMAAQRGWTRPGVGGFLVNLVVIGAVSLLLAGLTYRCVERPALARKQRPGAPRVVPPSPTPVPE